MKLYIAGSSHPNERPRIDEAFGSVCNIPGLTFVGDWRQDVDQHGANPMLDAERFAQKDLDAVRDCDVFWFLIPLEQTRGAWVELGYAMALGKSIIASGHTPSQSVFCALLRSHCRLDKHASEAIRELAAMTSEAANV